MRMGSVPFSLPADFMVVAPYNDQVHLVREVLAEDERTAAVKVGTVDKFQGREAPVVFFTMATSTGDDMPRGPEFLILPQPAERGPESGSIPCLRCVQ